MYSFIWQLVSGLGKLPFLIAVKNRFVSVDRDRQKTRSLAGTARQAELVATVYAFDDSV